MHVKVPTHALLLQLFLVWIFCTPGYAQDGHLDSLWSIWKDDTRADTVQLDAVVKLIWDGYLYSQPDSAFELAQMAYDFAEARGLNKHMGFALNIQGISYRVRGEYAKALVYYQRCLDIREAMGDKKRVAGSLNNIGLIYATMDQYPKALEYYRKSLRIYEEIDDPPGAANVLNNIGIIYVSQGDKAKALEYFQRSLRIYEENRDKKAIADCLTNIGNNYKDQGKFSEAMQHYRRGLEIYGEIGDQKGIADCLINMGHTNRAGAEYRTALENYQESLLIYEHIGDKYGIVNCLVGIGRLYDVQGQHQKAIQECHKGLQLAREIETIAKQRDACNCLYEAYKALGNAPKALEYHEHYQGLSTSLQAEETTRQLERIEFQKQILADSLRQEEDKLRMQMENEEKLARESKRRNIAIGGGIMFVLLAASLYARVRYMRRSKAVIEKERDRSNNLLLNILPYEIAEELKEKGHAAARDFEQVSILFTDFKDFTETSGQLSAHELVNEINACFEAFDRICDECGIEKIKTIGDAYMAAGGLPVPTKDAARNTVLAGLRMAAFMRQRKAERSASGAFAFEMRVGIHTGPVVAGIVGVKKFQYDIWGDTVNTASRLESQGEVGKVNISHDTYHLIKDDPMFRFEARGRIYVKGKGELEMWFVEMG